MRKRRLQNVPQKKTLQSNWKVSSTSKVLMMALRTCFEIYTRETNCLSVRDKILNGNLGIHFMHRNTTSSGVLTHGRLINVSIQKWFILFQQYSYLNRDFMSLNTC